MLWAFGPMLLSLKFQALHYKGTEQDTGGTLVSPRVGGLTACTLHSGPARKGTGGASVSQEEDSQV